MKKNKAKPDRIIQTIEENFKDVLAKPDLKNLGLTSIAIAKAEKMTINEIARCLPIDVKNQKAKVKSNNCYGAARFWKRDSGRVTRREIEFILS